MPESYLTQTERHGHYFILVLKLLQAGEQYWHAAADYNNTAAHAQTQAAGATNYLGMAGAK